MLPLPTLRPAGCRGPHAIGCYNGPSARRQLCAPDTEAACVPGLGPAGGRPRRLPERLATRPAGCQARWMPARGWGSPFRISRGAPSLGPFGERRSGLRLPCQAEKGPCVPCWQPARSQTCSNVAAVTLTGGPLRPCQGSAASLARAEGGTWVLPPAPELGTTVFRGPGRVRASTGGPSPLQRVHGSRREKCLPKPQCPRSRPLARLHLPLSSSVATHHPLEQGPWEAPGSIPPTGSGTQ